MSNVKDFTKGQVIVTRDGRELTVLTTKPQVMGHYLKTPEDPTVMVMVRGTGRGYDLFYNQADLDSGAYVLKS